ncbi:MAG: YggS family pyridoxal phosphate-dependent enzyme [bacterium]
MKSNIENIRMRIARAAERSGRNPGEIKLIAVTKYVPEEKIKEAIEAGITGIGENRVREAERKYLNLKVPVEWHMIGHLQTNKVKKAAGIFGWIQSIDSSHLAEELNSSLLSTGKKIKVLVEVNVSGEESKYGVKPGDAENLVKEILNLPQLEMKGLMTMAPLSENPEDTRPYFRKLRMLLSGLQDSTGRKIEYLSMGMTGDFEAAVEEGANIVRIGRGIFGTSA